MIVDDADVAQRRERLADELRDKGQLLDPAWRAAFLAVRRHVFVPRFWHDDEPGAFPARWRMVDNATVDHDKWLDAVYSNRTLVTELTGVPAPGGMGMHPQVTSSSTMPGLVMAMLEALEVADGEDVLEVGTGSGYNAALLCQRLGDRHVTTIDIGAELTALARVRLAGHGYHPHAVTGDGADGVPERAPFDRIIATCGLDRIPPAWIEQTRERGKILVNVLGPWDGYTLVALTVHGDTASGRFLAQPGGFMPRRTDPARAFDHGVTVNPAGDAIEGSTQLDPAALYDSTSFGLVAQVCLGDIVAHQIVDDVTGQPATAIGTADTSWAVVDHTAEHSQGFRVRQFGPRHLWDEVETVHRRWVGAGQPGRERFGVTVDGSARRLWLDDPNVSYERATT